MPLSTSTDLQPRLPDFFDQAPTLTVRDPLSEFLGAAEGGMLRYGYADAVRLAGHSCPTVAGAYLMTLHGLRALYGDALPVRGEVAAFMHDARDSGTTGVTASVVQLLTGAAPETGFHGIGPTGRFARNELLHFGRSDVPGVFGLQRTDTGAAVALQLNAALVPWNEEMPRVLPYAIAGRASEEQLRRFGQLWQQRVRAMLVDFADDAQLVQVTPWDKRH